MHLYCLRASTVFVNKLSQWVASSDGRPGVVPGVICATPFGAREVFFANAVVLHCLFIYSVVPLALRFLRRGWFVTFAMEHDE